MFLQKSKHCCLFLAVLAISHFDAIAGKSDLLLKGATAPVRMSSSAWMLFSYHPTSSHVMSKQSVKPTFSRPVSSAYLENGYPTRQNRVAGGLLEDSECNIQEKDLPYVLEPDGKGGAIITFASEKEIKAYLNDVTLTKQWEAIKKPPRDLDKNEYYKMIKLYPVAEQNAHYFWNDILSLQGSKITRDDFSKRLQNVAEEAKTKVIPEDAREMDPIIDQQRVAFDSLFTNNKKALINFLQSLKKIN